MKSVILSIKPQHCELIASGKKTVEVRKTRPKLDVPFKCYIYCTKPKYIYEDVFSVPTTPTTNGGYIYAGGKAIGEFVCDKIGTIKYFTNYGYRFNKFDLNVDKHCLSYEELDKYLDCSKGYGWHISDLVIYDKPKELSEFRKPCIMPEQPYCPCCEVGYEYISETEAEFYRVDGECFTEWVCLNYLKRPPQSWCYVEGLG